MMSAKLEVMSDDFLKFGVELVTAMTKALVDHPDQIRVEMIEGENTTVFRLHTASGDLGQVLGKKGANIFLLREILKKYASKHKRRAVLEVAEAAVSSHAEPRLQIAA